MKFLRKCVRNQQNFLEIPFINTVHNGTESISYLESKILNIVPDEIKQVFFKQLQRIYLKMGTLQIALVDSEKGI